MNVIRREIVDAVGVSNSQPADRPVDTGTLGKGMEVLEIVSAAGGPIRFTDILSRSAQPRGTLHRQITNLVSEGLLTANADHSYELGLRLMQLASSAWSSNEFRQVAAPHLRALQEQTGETVHLGIMRGQQIIYLDKVEGQQSVRMHSQIGNASPLYCTGVGKAALAAFDDDDIRERMQGVEFTSFTQNTLSDVDALVADVAEIRESGIGWDREEHEAGIHCVASPVFSPQRNIVAAISATAPIYRIPSEQLEGWAPLVRETARNIMNEMVSRLSPRT